MEGVAADRPPSRIAIRDSRGADFEAIRAIYAHHVLNGLASFEETPPAIDDLLSRRNGILRLGLPYLVAETPSGVVGYAYAAPYRARAAYRYSIEDSVYVADGLHRRGIGRALLGALIERCAHGPWRQMIAVIGDTGNAASIGLHQSLGFQWIGTLRAVGFKFGRWVDTVLMQRELGEGSGTPPRNGSAGA